MSEQRINDRHSGCLRYFIGQIHLYKLQIWQDIRIEIYTLQNDGQKKMRMIVCDLQIPLVVAESYTQAEIIMFKKRYQQAWDLKDQQPKLTFDYLDDSIELELGLADRHENINYKLILIPFLRLQASYLIFFEDTGSKEKDDGGSQQTTWLTNEEKMARE